MIHEMNPFAGRDASAPDPKPELREQEFWAVSDISFQLRRGECLGLIGHNGAGKSTLLKILNGLIPPDAGRITMRGRVAALIELNAGFNPILTGRENIYNQAALLGFSKAETDAKFDAIVEFAEISEFLDMAVQNYSSGMRVRLGFAVAVQLEPDVLIIDEVLAVGDVAFRFKCLNAIGQLMRSAAVIFVSHTMPQIFRICTEVIVLDHGKATCQTRHIADGVAVYLSLFKGGNDSVAGSGEVVVTSVSAAAGEGRAGMGETLLTDFGSQLTLTACFRIARPLPQFRVQFVLWNSEMLPVMDIVADDLRGHLVETPASGVVEVSAVIPRLEINAGKYSLSVIAVSKDQDMVPCRYDNALFLQINAACASGAFVLAVAHWNAATPNLASAPCPL